MFISFSISCFTAAFTTRNARHQLVVDLLQGPLHPALAVLDVVHLPHQGVLHPVVHNVDTLPPLPEQCNEGNTGRVQALMRDILSPCSWARISIIWLLTPLKRTICIFLPYHFFKSL